MIVDAQLVVTKMQLNSLHYFNSFGQLQSTTESNNMNLIRRIFSANPEEPRRFMLLEKGPRTRTEFTASFLIA